MSTFKVVVSVPHHKSKICAIISNSDSYCYSADAVSCMYLTAFSVKQECVQWKEPCCACEWAVRMLRISGLFHGHWNGILEWPKLL